MFDARNPVPLERGQALETYLNLEELRMAAAGYENSEKVVLRKIALRVIHEISKCENFDASIPYIAMNYFDRYISRHPVPHLIGRFRIDLHVFSICCLMLAWKLRYQRFKAETFLAQNDLRYLQTPILRGEVELLMGLNWKTTPITALCFVDLIIERIPDANGISRRFINEIIVQSQGDITFTRFRPSLIAASAILSACRYQYFNRSNRCRGSLLALEFVNAADLDTCTNKILAMCVDKRITVHGHLNVEAGETSQVGAGTAEAGQSFQVGAGTSGAGQSSQGGQGRQFGETSGAGQSSQEGETSEAGRISVFGETSEGVLTHLFGEAAESEVEEISEEGQTSRVVMFPRRDGKEPIGETPAAELTPQRALSRDRVQEIAEIQEVQNRERRDSDDMNFDLKWLLWNADNPEDLIIESARFRPLPNPPARTEAEANTNSNAIKPKCSYCNVM